VVGDLIEGAGLRRGQEVAEDDLAEEDLCGRSLEGTMSRRANNFRIR
jgi:hypothetical protein